MAMLALLLVALAAPGDRKVYAKDVKFALNELEKQCGHFFKPKGIQWKKVRRQFTKEAKNVRTHEEHWMLLWRLVVRLKDGHADVHTTQATKQLQWPGTGLDRGPQTTWCTNGRKIHVKRSWGSAEGNGVRPGMEVVRVDGVTAAKWLEQRIAELSDRHRLPNDHFARFFACHWGLGGPLNSRLKLELYDAVRRRTKKATLMRTGRGLAPAGPVFLPERLKRMERLTYGRLPSGHGYIHLRNVPRDLPARMDTMLAEMGNVKGLILDCRANGGGATDHDAVFGRFVPQGKTLSLSPRKTYRSQGPSPYIGPMVVIVDAGARSAGETISGMFKEDGRAYMIGPNPTAGMSSSKTTIELPSGLFSLYVSVASNKGRFNRGKGIEGIGVAPHETVPYEPAELAQGVDTQIRRAGELLDKGFPKNTVPYKPDRYGWKKPK